MDVELVPGPGLDEITAVIPLLVLDAALEDGTLTRLHVVEDTVAAQQIRTLLQRRAADGGATAVDEGPCVHELSFAVVDHFPGFEAGAPVVDVRVAAQQQGIALGVVNVTLRPVIEGFPLRNCQQFIDLSQREGRRVPGRLLGVPRVLGQGRRAGEGAAEDERTGADEPTDGEALSHGSCAGGALRTTRGRQRRRR